MSLLQLLFQFFFAPFIGVELTASPEQFSYPTLTDHSYRIVQDAEGTGSCFDYSVYDDQGRVTLPREVQDELYCNPTLTIADSYPLLLHIGGNWNLNIYNLATEQLTTLMTFHPDTDGLECQFSPSDTTIACVSVNQERYDELTRIFILDITPEGQLLDKRQYHHTVDYVCGASCYPQFTFLDDHTLQYQGHNAIEDPQKTHTLKF